VTQQQQQLLGHSQKLSVLPSMTTSTQAQLIHCTALQRQETSGTDQLFLIKLSQDTTVPVSNKVTSVMVDFACFPRHSSCHDQQCSMLRLAGAGSPAVAQLLYSKPASPVATRPLHITSVVTLVSCPSATRNACIANMMQHPVLSPTNDCISATISRPAITELSQAVLSHPTPRCGCEWCCMLCRVSS
jgi:hypothetical protein